MGTALKGWDSLRHSGLLLDARHQQIIAELGAPEPLYESVEHDLRKGLDAALNGDVRARQNFIPFVLGKICGLDTQGTWQRGSQIPKECGHKTPMGEITKPQHIWESLQGGSMAVFIDLKEASASGIGRRMSSKALHWLRRSNRHLAVLTNGRYWRLLFAGLDFEAYCEWDSELWFEEGCVSDQALLLRRLLHPDMWTPEEEGEHSPLLKAIFGSRRGQADLSMIMGEKIRQAVELLIWEHTSALRRDCKDVDHSVIYRAAVRIIMRLVVIMFAEARELLPRDRHLYRNNYGLGGLIESLRNTTQRNPSALAQTFGAWPRVLSLFRLIYGGSHHEAIPLYAYGGDLFAPHGDLKDMEEGYAVALGVFERGCFDNDQGVMSDATVHGIFNLITRTEIRLKQNRSYTKVSAPVDFVDLSNDYIGILYEGLLDFELHLAQEGNPVVFLGVGDEPALPLSALESMDDSSIKTLLKSKKSNSEGDEDARQGESDQSDQGNMEEDVERNLDDETVEQENDERTLLRNRAFEWASKAVRVTLSAKASDGDVDKLARKIVKRVVLPGEFYLARWGGTRKGSGTFYTPLGIVAPTVKRTLDPLLAVRIENGVVAKEIGIEQAEIRRKSPEEILSLKILDPACGSGAFLVSAVRLLTDTLYDSLHEHGRITRKETRSLVRILGIELGNDGDHESIADENIPCPPDDQQFEVRLKAILRRYVVERCIYGVDIDPLAVELCRMSLWIETMDRELRFNFLDHKIKCGDSLVGSWLDETHHYPVMAWKNREAGDEKHDSGVHYAKGQKSEKIRFFARDTLKHDMLVLIDSPLLSLDKETEIAHKQYDEILSALARIHNMPVQTPTQQAEEYRYQVIASDAYRSLKDTMDLWCSCWFWPPEKIGIAPLPTNLHAPQNATIQLSRSVAKQRKFFHWELEFPEAFNGENKGFDAVLGNPPWNLLLPKSTEYFSRIDPLYRTYGRQDAVSRQKELFVDDEEAESNWIDYLAWFRSFSNFIAHSYNPFGDPQRSIKPTHKFSLGVGRRSAMLHDKWRKRRSRSCGYAFPDHPFLHQGESNKDLYQLFLEQAFNLLRKNGRVGYLVPAGIHSDHGTKKLRKMFLDNGRWEWVFGFINSEKIFPSVHSSYKADVIIVERGKKTESIHVAFEQPKMETWSEGEKQGVSYPMTQLQRLSPREKVLVEIHGKKDLEVLEKVYEHCTLLENNQTGWHITYSTEFHMTNDSKYFPARGNWEKIGYRPDEYSRWLKGKWRPIEELNNSSPQQLSSSHYVNLPFPRSTLQEGIILSREFDAWICKDEIEGIALPLYQGRMIGLLDFSAKAYAGGLGSSTKWKEIPWDAKRIEPQFLMREDKYYEQYNKTNPTKGSLSALKLGVIRIGGSTNTRTMMAAPIMACPCGNNVPTLTPSNRGLIPALAILLNSFAYDYVLRARLASASVSKYILDETPLPHVENLPLHHLNMLSTSLCMSDVRFANMWVQYTNCRTPWRQGWAITNHERRRKMAMCDAISFSLFGYDLASAHHVMSGCDIPLEECPPHLAKMKLPSGFWRVDQDKKPELRQTILTLVAFHDLQRMISENCANQRKGIEKFIEQNDEQGWMIPETLRLADYGLGHDRRAHDHQPVVSEFGPRFFDWQLNQDVEESWKECQLHALNLFGKDGGNKQFQKIPTAQAEMDSTGDEGDAARPSLRTLF